MCPPAIIAGISLAASIGGTLASNAAANASADEQERAARAARIAAVREQGFAQAEIKEDAASRITQARRQTRVVRSLSAVGAGEAGVAGISANAVLNDIERQALDFEVGTNRQSRREVDSLERQKMSQLEIERNRAGGAGRPSAFGTFLEFTGAAAQFAQFEILSRDGASTDATDATQDDD